MAGLHSWKEEAFKALLNHSEIALVCLSEDGCILELNRGAENLFDWRMADVVNKNFLELCKQAGHQLPIQKVNEIVSRSIKHLISVLHTNEEKIYVEWHISPLYDAESKTNRILLVGLNVTLHKKAEKKLQKTNTYLNHIVNNLPHFIFWKDSNSVFLGCNKKFSDSIGLESARDIVGKTDYDMPWSKEQSDVYRKDDKKIMTTGTTKLGYEESQRQLDGTEKTMLVSKVPMYDETKQIIGLLGIYTDITERKKMEEDLREAKSQAEIANEIKTNFISNVEHDVRTPFSGLFGLSNFLATQEMDAEKKELLNDIASCAKALLDYFNDILDFSKIEARERPLLAKKFDLIGLVEKIGVMERVPAKSKNIEFTIDVAPNVPKEVVSDSYRIQRILMNLIGNAIKFTHEGFVKLDVKSGKTIYGKSCIELVVSDSGIGIPEDKQNIVYEKFSRVIPSNKGTHKGVGLGLSVVKRFIDELEGQIDIKSKPEIDGTVFTCIIPIDLPLLAKQET